MRTQKTTSLLNFVIIVLYLLTLFIPSLGSFDYAVTQWLYIGAINVIVCIYYLYTKSYLNIFLPKYVKWFFWIQIAVLLVSCLSMLKAINIQESIIYITRIIAFIAAIFNLYVALHKSNNFGFYAISLLLSVILFVEAIQIVEYFVFKYSEPRTGEMLLSIPHKYGNRNILATALAIKLPFLLYLYYNTKTLFKYILVLFSAFIAVAAILLVGARTAALIMLLTLCLFPILNMLINKSSIKQSVLKVLPLFIISIMAFVASISINRIYEDKLNTYKELFFTKTEKDLYNPTAKVNLVQGSGRDIIWQSAIDIYKTSPIIGVGIGNWRHINKEHLLKHSATVGITFYTHVHNDFLQALAETGIIGLILYLATFIILVFLLYKYVFSEQPIKNKLFAIVLALAIMAYAIDAFFNFPHHRAPIQIVFAFVIALSLFIVTNNKQRNITKNKKLITIIGVLSTIVLFIVLIINYKEYKASTVQYKLISEIKTHDAFSGKFKYHYEDVKQMLPDFPYINQTGFTNDDTKGLYAISDKQYKKALYHLDKSIKNTQITTWPRALKAMVYRKLENEDSTYYYAKSVFDVGPSIESCFYILRKIYKKRNDTTALFDLYDRHFKVRPKNTIGWLNMCNDIRTYYKDNALALSKVNEALERYPYDEKLINYKKKLVALMPKKKSKSDKIAETLDKTVIEKMTKHFQTANSYFDKKDYNNARIEFLKVLDLEPNNLPTHFKLGLLENLSGNYKQAIPYLTKVIDDKYLDNGRPEYSRFLAYYKSNNLEKAKKDFYASRKKGWKAALKLDENLFNQTN